MKQKRSVIRATDEFNIFLESVWRLSQFRAKGIESKSDLFRYAVINTVEKTFPGILKEFKHVPEIKEYLNPTVFVRNKDKIEQSKARIEEYMKKRQTGEIKFENGEDNDG